MRKLTNEEFTKVVQIINGNPEIHEMVNSLLLAGTGWDNVMYDVAKAYKIVK